jgi:ketosteroid isomerase-like protein
VALKATGKCCRSRHAACDTGSAIPATIRPARSYNGGEKQTHGEPLGRASMTTATAKIMAELADREAIRECLYRYARGVDRLDADMVRSAYWPDAVDQHLEFTGNAEEFIAWSFPIMRMMDQTMHMIANVLMTIRGDVADIEAYFYGYHRVTIEGTKRDVIGAGRYIDRFEKRDDEWRVAQRLVITDWFRTYPDSADWETGMLGQRIDIGSRFPDDPSYTRIALA